MRATVRLFLTRDRSRVVGEDDPDAGFLLAAAGSEVSDDVARRYGLTGEPDPVPEVLAKAVEFPPETKMQRGPARSKRSRS